MTCVEVVLRLRARAHYIDVKSDGAVPALAVGTLLWLPLLFKRSGTARVYLGAHAICVAVLLDSRPRPLQAARPSPS